ncbi:MAG: hypothetical protein KDD64_10930, partial [Bdellovibrionales bacterium]|nr:hypothetical protein [Bdellovibrionales bacterium]
WVRVWFAGIPGHERTVWFAEAEARAEFPGVLEEPDREYHDFVSRMTHRHNSLGAHISPLPPRCTERLSQIPRGQYDELTEVQAFQKVISETVRISKDPQELQLAYGLLIRELSENQSKFGIHLDAFMDSSITTIPEPSLDAHFKFQTLLGLVQDGFNLRPNRGYRDSGNYVANVGAVMVDLSAGGKRPLNAELEAERILLCAVFQGALEEVIHAWQIEYERRGTETETKNVIHVPEEGTSFRLLSLLAASFFQQFPGVLSRVDGKERMELIAEVDVVGKMVELYSEAEIPLERLALELFSYHVDFRRKFVLWLVDEGVVPREIVPDKFFDDSVRRALRLSELGEPLFVKDRRFLPKL